MASSRWSKGLRAIALFEVAKGLLGLGVAYVLMTQGQRDIERLCSWVVATFHLDPDEGLGVKILGFADQVDASRVKMLTILAFAYVVVRFVEAYGLWRERRWAEWFAALSAGLYIPFELWELVHHMTPAKFLVVGLNVGVVAFLVKVIMRDRRLKTETKAQENGLA